MGEIGDGLNKLERKYGKGPTYGRGDRDLILKHGVPEWLVRCRLLLSGEAAARADRAIKQLEALHKEVFPRVADPHELAPKGD